MPYLGREGQFGVRNRFQYLASAGDTSFSGADANGITMTFDDGLYVDVFLNGVKLKAGEDYNTNTANTIAGITALDANDEIEVIAYDAFSAADTVSAADGGTFSGAVTMNGNHTVGGNLAVTGTSTLTGNLAVTGTSTLTNTLTANSGIVIANDANIGSAGDADSMAINSSGVVTFSQAPIITTSVWPAFRAILSANQTGLSDATYTKLELDTEQFDTTGDYDSSTNYRFTPSVAGYYQLNGGAGDANNTTYQVYVGIYKNGSIYAIQGDYHASDGGSNGARYTRQSVSTVMHMNGSTDYAELFFFDNVASGTGTVHGGTGDGAFFDGILVQRTG